MGAVAAGPLRYGRTRPLPRRPQAAAAEDDDWEEASARLAASLARGVGIHCIAHGGLTRYAALCALGAYVGKLTPNTTRSPSPSLAAYSVRHHRIWVSAAR